MLFIFVLLFPPHPTPLRSQAFVTMQSIMLAMGSVGQEKPQCAIRVETKHLDRSYSILCCLFSYFSFLPTLLPSHFHAFVAMQFIMLAMWSVGLGELA